MWRVFKSDASWYDRDTGRLCIDDSHKLNFFDVETVQRDNVELELELGEKLDLKTEENSLHPLDDCSSRHTVSEVYPELPGKPEPRKKPEVPPQRALYMKTQQVKEVNVKF